MIEVGPWYLRVWMPDGKNFRVEFEAARAVAWEGEAPLFARRGTLAEHRNHVSSLEAAEPDVRGDVRFDGGIHVVFGIGDGYLYADHRDLVGLGALFERVRVEAVRLFDAAGAYHEGLDPGRDDIDPNREAWLPPPVEPVLASGRGSPQQGLPRLDVVGGRLLLRGPDLGAAPAPQPPHRLGDGHQEVTMRAVEALG